MDLHRTDEAHLLSSYNYHLPAELIAQEPVHPRDSSRFMVCGLEEERIDHLRFSDLPDLLSSDDILVVNDSRVIPARVKCHKSTGGKSEVLFLSTDPSQGPLEALIKGRIREGGTIIPDKGGIACLAEGGRKAIGTSDSISIRVVRHISEGRFEVEVKGTDDVNGFLDRAGEMPVPPYIRKPLAEREDYQTVYSREAGSVAAPTAGLHFTEELLDRLQRNGVRIVPITLHVSIGTFLPVRDNDIQNHTMEPEYFQVGKEAEELLHEREGKMGEGGGGNVIAVGTTVVKTLESAFQGIADGVRKNAGLKKEGWSNLFIYPGHKFRSPLSGMITNFHLPASTLIMLVSSYAGRDRILRYYEEAVRERYRFYSFGDAMYLKGRPR